MAVNRVNGAINQALFVNTAGTINTAQIIGAEGLGTPAISSAVAGDTQVTLTWSAVDGATNYDVRIDGSTILSDVGSSPYAVTSLTNDTKYDFEVRATDGESDGAWSSSVSRTPVSWQLSAFYYVVAKMPPQIIFPKPDPDVNDWARHRMVPSALTMRMPVGVQGGARPLNYAVSGPSGMSVSQDGILTYTSPQIGAHTVTLTIRTQDYGRQPDGRTDEEWGEVSVTWTMNVYDREDNTRFIFLSGTGNDSNDGSYASPKLTLAAIFESTLYASRQLHFLTGTFNTDGTGAFFAPGNNTPMVLTGVTGQAPVINFTQKAFTPSNNDDFYLGELSHTEGGYGATLANARWFQPYSGVDRFTFFNNLITNPGNGTAGNDNPSFLMTGSGASRKNHACIMHNTETGRAATSNSAALYVLFGVDNGVSEYNTVSCSSPYNMFLKDSTSTWTVANNYHRGGTYSMATGCQLAGGISEDIEICYNNTDAEIRLNLQAANTSGEHWVYRNSTTEDIFIWNTNEANTGPYNIEKNAVEGTISTGTRVISTDDECVAASGVLDDDLLLMGTYRDNYLYQRGAEKPSLAVIPDENLPPVIFNDDFSSGDFSGAIYSGIPVNATVTDDNPLTSTHSLRFNFAGNASGGDATAQRNFNLGALYDRVTLEFDLYIPDGTEGFGAAHNHRNDSPSNNKLFRIWSNNGINGGNNGYASLETMGASLTANGTGGSNLAVEWVLPIYSSVGTNATYSNFITVADHGTWINCRFYMQYPTAAGANDGIYRIWRNGTLIIDELLDNWREDELHGMQFGYLLGAANSGFDNDTTLFLDNLVFRGVEL